MPDENHHCIDSGRDHASGTNAGTRNPASRVRALCQRGMAEGHAVHDWLAAEAELVSGHSETADLNRKTKR